MSEHSSHFEYTTDFWTRKRHLIPDGQAPMRIFLEIKGWLCSNRTTLYLGVDSSCNLVSEMVENQINVYFSYDSGRQSPVFFIFKTLRPKQNGCYFADNIFKCIFFNENVWIPIKISLKFVPKGAIWPSLRPCTVINPILLTYLFPRVQFTLLKHWLR